MLVISRPADENVFGKQTLLCVTPLLFIYSIHLTVVSAKQISGTEVNVVLAFHNIYLSSISVWV